MKHISDWPMSRVVMSRARYLHNCNGAVQSIVLNPSLPPKACLVTIFQRIITMGSTTVAFERLRSVGK
jgi:hypothetical protein